MLTAKDIVNVLRVLELCDTKYYELNKDPTFVGHRSADAFHASLPLLDALKELNVPFTKGDV
jgi:hypothetical protein